MSGFHSVFLTLFEANEVGLFLSQIFKETPNTFVDSRVYIVIPLYRQVVFPRASSQCVHYCCSTTGKERDQQDNYYQIACLLYLFVSIMGSKIKKELEVLHFFTLGELGLRQAQCTELAITYLY